MIYFIADLHFGDTGIQSWERPRFKDVTKHDQVLIRQFLCLNNNDEVYVLGDIGRLDDKNLEMFRKIKCHLYLIKGNHDTRKDQYYLDTFGFEKVYDHPFYITERILLSHEPMVVGNDIINIHGHLHNSRLNLPNYFNVNWAMNNYQFMTLHQVQKKMSSIPKISHVFLKEWYAANYQFIDNQRKDIEMDESGNIDIEATLAMDKWQDRYINKMDYEEWKNKYRVETVEEKQEQK